MNAYLPINDPNPASRRAALERARIQWTYGTGLKPLATAAAVPSADRPRLRWAALIAGPLAKVALNDAANRAAWLTRNPVFEMVADASAGLEAIGATSSTAEHESFAALGERFLVGDRAVLEGLGAAPAALLSDQDAQYLALEAERRLREVFTAASSDSANALEGISFGGPRGRPGSLKDYSDLYRKIDLPAPAVEFNTSGLTDDVFVRLRVAGPNPEMLVCVDKVPSGFLATLKLSDGTSAEDAAAKHRLFLADYEDIAGVVPHAPKRGWTPRALFAVNATGALEPVAIQCTPVAGPVFTPGTTGWERAKHVVQVADTNYHELIAHLGRTHLFVEPFLMATHRELAPGHPINRLLIPHFEGTVFINDNARSSLIAPGGAVDLIFSGTIESSRAVSLNGVRTLDFSQAMLPQRIAARRTEEIKEYPWRDDALLIWAAVEQFVGEYVRHWYASDSDVTEDVELQRWAAVLDRPFDAGGMTGFTRPTTIQQLTSALTLIIYTASAQHAAVNFPQFPDMSYAPFTSGAGWDEGPSAAAPAPEPPLSFYPPLEIALRQTNLLFLLSSVHYTQLGRYPSSWFDDPAIDTGMVGRFQRSLAAVEQTIVSSNLGRRFPYEHLRPSLIPQSINI